MNKTSGVGKPKSRVSPVTFRLCCFTHAELGFVVMPLTITRRDPGSEEQDKQIREPFCCDGFHGKKVAGTQGASVPFQELRPRAFSAGQARIKADFLQDVHGRRSTDRINPKLLQHSENF